MVWGDPYERTWQASLRGELVLAGCVIEMDERGDVARSECLAGVRTN
jgi:hypothetical protein